MPVLREVAPEKPEESGNPKKGEDLQNPLLVGF